MKITAEFDSKNHEMVVRKDGKIIDDVEAVVFSPSFSDPKKGHVELTTVSKDEDKVLTVTRIMAEQVENKYFLQTNSMLTAYRLYDEDADVELDYGADDLELDEESE
jgi:hypothetical protein